MHASESARSFATIVPLHAAAMLRLAAALIGPTEAEDAVQEASMRAWQAWPTLRNLDAVRPWLLQITLNVCRQWRRGLKGQQWARMQTLPEDTDGAHLRFLSLLDTDPGTSNHTGSLDLRAAINALPDDLRSIVILRFYVGLDATEIGAMLRIPSGTVRSRLHRAMLQMREQLQPPGVAGATQPEMEGRS